MSGRIRAAASSRPLKNRSGPRAKAAAMLSRTSPPKGSGSYRRTALARVSPPKLTRMTLTSPGLPPGHCRSTTINPCDPRESPQRAESSNGWGIRTSACTTEPLTMSRLCSRDSDTGFATTSPLGERISTTARAPDSPGGPRAGSTTATIRPSGRSARGTGGNRLGPMETAPRGSSRTSDPSSRKTEIRRRAKSAAHKLSPTRPIAPG